MLKDVAGNGTAVWVARVQIKTEGIKGIIDMKNQIGGSEALGRWEVRILMQDGANCALRVSLDKTWDKILHKILGKILGKIFI